MPGKATLRSSDSSVEPLSTRVPRPTPSTNRGSTQALPLVTFATATSSGSVHRVPSYRAVPCCRSPASTVPSRSSSPMRKSWTTARSLNAPSSVAESCVSQSAMPSPSTFGSRTRTTSSRSSARLAARSTSPFASRLSPRPIRIVRPSKARSSIARSAFSATSSPSARAGIPERKSDGSNLPSRPKRPAWLVTRMAATRSSSLRTSSPPVHCDQVPSPRSRAV